MNVHAWVVFLLFESFLNLFNVQTFKKKLKSRNWSSTNSARLLELLCRIKVNQFDFPRMAVNLVAQVARLDVSMCKNHPRCTCGEPILAGKDFEPVMGVVGRGILWVYFDWLSPCTLSPNRFDLETPPMKVSHLLHHDVEVNIHLITM